MGGQNSAVRTHFHPLESAPDGWPLHGEFFPLGPDSQAKGDWHYFWKDLACKKRMLADGVKNPEPKGTELGAPETVQAITDNLRTHVLATVYCPGWAHGWASFLLDLIVRNAPTTSFLKLLAVKGGPACDEEIAFLFVLMGELGFGDPTVATWISGKSLVATWRMPRKGVDVEEYAVELIQFCTVHDTRDMDMSFAPPPGKFTCTPNLFRYAVISCAEKWCIDGQALRINPSEVDENHVDGMTVNDKLNSMLVASLKTTKDRATKKGFRPTFVASDGRTYSCMPWRAGEHGALAREYFDRPS